MSNSKDLRPQRKNVAKTYCYAYGCANNTKDNDDLTFFTLPTDMARRRKWLKLVDREDLLQNDDLKRSTHLLCSAHFEDSSFKLIRHLKKDALPSLRLHNRPRPRHSAFCSGESSTSSAPNKLVTIGTQTESQTTEEPTQTSEETSREQKLTNMEWECDLKSQKLDQEITKIKQEMEAIEEVEVMIPLFISHVDPESSEEAIIEYIENKTNVTITLEKIQMKEHKPYNAYKIFVPHIKLAMFLDDGVWPEGMRFQHYVKPE